MRIPKLSLLNNYLHFKMLIGKCNKCLALILIPDVLHPHFVATLPSYDQVLFNAVSWSDIFLVCNTSCIPRVYIATHFLIFTLSEQIKLVIFVILHFGTKFTSQVTHTWHWPKEHETWQLSSLGMNRWHHRKQFQNYKPCKLWGLPYSKIPR